GHLLLADEEAREPVHPLVALLLRDPLVPVDPVLREVEVLRGPLLLLPEVVELVVVEQLHLGLRGVLEGRVRRGLEVLSLGSRRPRPSRFLRLYRLHLGLLSSSTVPAD